jgi:serine/threonine protein kinase
MDDEEATLERPRKRIDLEPEPPQIQEPEATIVPEPKTIPDEKPQEEMQLPLEEVKTTTSLISEQTPLAEKAETSASLIQERATIPRVQTQALDDFLSAFEFKEVIGSGGISTISLVEQRSNHAKFAYKEINLEQIGRVASANPEAILMTAKLLDEEARLINEMAAIDPKHFPPFAVAWTHSDRPGFLTKYYPKSSLEKQVGKLSPERAVQYALDAAEAINSLHTRKNIVLADVKPSQFVLDEQDNVVLVDLNLKYADKEFSSVSTMIHSVALSFTESPSKLHGTPRYMAPEQWEKLEGKDSTVDARTDVFQMGSMLYEFLTGRKPEGKWKKLAEINPALTKLDEVIDKALANGQGDRYQTMQDFIDAVKERTRPKDETSNLQKTLAQLVAPIEIEEHTNPIAYWTARGKQTEQLLVEFYKAARATLKGKRVFTKKGNEPFESNKEAVQFDENSAKIGDLNGGEFNSSGFTTLDNAGLKMFSYRFGTPHGEYVGLTLEEYYSIKLKSGDSIETIKKFDESLRSLPERIMAEVAKGNYRLVKIKEPEKPRDAPSEIEKKADDGKLGKMREVQQKYELPTFERWRSGQLSEEGQTDLISKYLKATLEDQFPDPKFGVFRIYRWGSDHFCIEKDNFVDKQVGIWKKRMKKVRQSTEDVAAFRLGEKTLIVTAEDKKIQETLTRAYEFISHELGDSYQFKLLFDSP